MYRVFQRVNRHVHPDPFLAVPRVSRYAAPQYLHWFSPRRVIRPALPETVAECLILYHQFVRQLLEVVMRVESNTTLTYSCADDLILCHGE